MPARWRHVSSPLLALLGVLTLGVTGCREDSPLSTEPNGLETTPVAAFDVTVTGDPLAVTDGAVTPSTNDANLTNGWAHVTYVDVGVGQVTLNFVAPRAFYSCFEYRIDLEDATSTANGGDNWNPAVKDGMWNYTCQNNSSYEIPFTAVEFVDVRMVFGAETDERFDWTRFYVLSLPNKDECKAGDWEAMGFKNQGQCVRYVETGKDSRVGD